MKPLPVGIQTFSKIIEDNYLYIDKTDIAKSIIEKYQYVFLSRPRRFGKSLFLDTLKNIFEGKQELFKDLLIYNQWNWAVTYPVIKISFSGGIHSKADLEEDLIQILKANEKRLDLKCENRSKAKYFFAELIQQASEKYQQSVVILIDEYDKPILDNIENIPEALIIRDGMRDFYTKIKESDEYLRFVFLTGVSKFSKVSLFSGLNNLEDISLNSDFGNICGYTQNDVDTTFAPYFEGVDMEEVKRWYNGYNFLGDKVYNPFDILLFIKNQKMFRNYWFETGTPRFLIELIKKNNYFVPNLNKLRINESLANSFNLENLNLETILFQAGYLTIKRLISTNKGVSYELGFPNKEVQISFNDYLLQELTTVSENELICDDLFELFNNGDIANLEPVIKRLFVSIAYNNFTNNYIESYEGFYASVLYAYFASLGFDMIAEDITNKGRIDLILKTFDKTYIFEFKVIAEEPLEQIKKMKYYEKYDGERYLIGIVFDPKARNVSQFAWERV
uniref:AAA-ATPase-like domain-containing protein n=1 Tax=Chlorobium chlorochromatii (strain CaD3) TaxID=340177 RepID=Q3ART9_CHLCH